MRTMIARALAQNGNAVVAGAGFVSLEVGVAALWSGAVAAIVAGVLLIGVGTWPYVVLSLRRKP